MDTTTRADRTLALWRGPAALTALVPVRDATADALRARLDILAPAIEGALAATETVHTLRMCAIAPDPALGRRDVAVLLNLVHDGPLADTLAELDRVAGAELADALGCARGDVTGLLGRHRHREQTLHVGAIRRTVRQIRADRETREAVQDQVDARLAADPGAAADPERIRRACRDALPEHLGRDPTPPVSVAGRLARLLDLLRMFLVPAMGVLGPDISAAVGRIERPWRRALTRGAWAAWWLYGAIPTGSTLLTIRLLELLEPDVRAPDPDPVRLARLEASEDKRPKNVVTLWFPVKGTLLRRLLLRVTLWGSDKGCRHVWTDGRLSGIDTIHHARILQVDGGRTLLFMSDYDGALNRYLDDFLGVGRRAVLPISANVHGCPPTRWMFRPGDPATFGPRWRSLIRLHQVDVPVWYHAYPTLTVQEILANAAIREGLCAPSLTDADAARWARRL